MNYDESCLPRPPKRRRREREREREREKEREREREEEVWDDGRHRWRSAMTRESKDTAKPPSLLSSTWNRGLFDFDLVPLS